MSSKNHHQPNDLSREEQTKMIASWLHDEQRCVSLFGIAQACGVSRQEARTLLQNQLVRDDVDRNNQSYRRLYQANMVSWHQENTPASSRNPQGGCVKSTGTCVRNGSKSGQDSQSVSQSASL